MNALPTPATITYFQAQAIREMHGKLGRDCPEIAHLTYEQAGDLIIELRAELQALEGGS